MKRFGMLVLSVAVFALSGAFADEKKEAFDIKKIEGKWTVTEGTKFGEAVDKKSLSGVIVIKKDVIQILEGEKVEHEMTYTIDAKTKPMNIDMKGTAGPAKDLSTEGIIELDGETLKLAYSFPGEKRPTAFKSEKDSKILYFVMKKAK